MKFQQNLITAAGLVIIALTFANAYSLINNDVDIGLMGFMARSNELLQQDPARSLSCFNYYIPLINEIAEKYQTNFEACLTASEAARVKAEEDTLDQRNDLSNAAEASCDLLSQCSEVESVTEIFQCYVNGVIVIILMTFVAGYTGLPKQENNINLLNLMPRLNIIIERNPARSLECFNYYLPLVNDLAKQYEENYEACVQASEENLREAEAASLDKRNELTSRSADSCTVLNACSEIESTEQAFECFEENGSENSKTMFGIHSDASEYLAELAEKIYLIKHDEYKCTNESKRAYQKEATQAYEDLNNCILGISPVPETSETPESPENTETPETTETPENTEVTESADNSENTAEPANLKSQKIFKNTKGSFSLKNLTPAL